MSKEQAVGNLRTVTLAVLMGLSGSALATEHAAAGKPAQRVADSSCRNVTDLKGTVHSYCGSAAQWAEFDRRMTKLEKGFSCRPVKGSPPLCLFARQWDYMSRTRSPVSVMSGSGGYAGLGEAAGQMLSMSVDANGYPAR